jgi:hypothetical protein
MVLHIRRPFDLPKAASARAVAILLVLAHIGSAGADDVPLGRFSIGGAATTPSARSALTPTAPVAPTTGARPFLQLSEQSSLSANFSSTPDSVLGDSEAALGMTYGTRLSPSVSLSLTPSVKLDRPAAMARMGADLDWGSVGLSLGLNWQITPNLGLSGTAGAGRQVDGTGPFGPLNLDSQVDLFTGLSLGLSF